MVGVCSFLVVFFLLIAICYFTSIVAGTTCKLEHNCEHNEYTKFFENCTFMECSPCPGCKKGMGLKKECGKPIIFNASDVLCIPCINGSTFNDVDQLKRPCKACDIQEHQKVISQCSKMNNTKYADACDAGYYFIGGNMDPCRLCSCCIKGVKTCREDGTNVQCTCREIPSTTETSTTPKPTDITTHNNISTVKHDSKAAGSSSSVPNWVTPVAASVSSILVILGILGMAVYCRRRYASGGSTEVTFGSGDGNELIEVHTDKRNTHARRPCVPQCIWSNQPCVQCFPCGHRTNSVQDNQQAPRIPQNVPDCKVSEMPFLLKSYLSLELDLKESYKANWHDVGKSLKLTKEQLKGLEIVSQKQDGSPAESMFTILETRGSEEPSVKDLVKVLIELGRYDIVDKWDWESTKRKT